MRNNVSFLYPEEFEPVSDEDGILSTQGAKWFVALLQQIADIQVETELCQEDWGVVIFVRRNQKRFWIGLGMCESDYAWLAHVHHHSFALYQRLSRSGNDELERLIKDLNDVLTADPKVSCVQWYREKDMNSCNPIGSRTPNDA